MRVVAVLFTVLLAMTGCSQSSPAPEQGEKEDVERAAEDPAVGAAECSDFASPEEAMDYYTSEASEAEKRALDENQDGFACNESAVASAQASSSPATEVESASADAVKAEAANEGLTVEQFNSVDNSTAYGEDLVRSLLSCQLKKYAQDHGTEAATKHAEELTLGLVLSEYPKNSNDPFKNQMEKEGVEPIYAEKGHDTVQAQLIDEGYTCSMAEISSH